jgi:hypothetical protein
VTFAIVDKPPLLISGDCCPIWAACRRIAHPQLPHVALVDFDRLQHRQDGDSAAMKVASDVYGSNPLASLKSL